MSVINKCQLKGTVDNICYDRDSNKSQGFSVAKNVHETLYLIINYVNKILKLVSLFLYIILTTKSTNKPYVLHYKFILHIIKNAAQNK